MAEIIRMPRLSDTMEEGNIVGWLKKVGDQVEPGDVLAEVETDKATMELESFQSGTLLYIGKEEGPVPVDGIIAIIGAKGEDYEAQLKEAEAASAPAAAEEPKKEEVKRLLKLLLPPVLLLLLLNLLLLLRNPLQHLTMEAGYLLPHWPEKWLRKPI